MKRINLGVLNLRGVRLSPHEAIAVVHQVCELLKHASDRGHALAPPTLHELFVTEDGEVELEPQRDAYDRRVGGSFRHLIDGLLPLDRAESERTFTSENGAYDFQTPGKPVHREVQIVGPPGTSDDRELLRHLFQRMEHHAVPAEAAHPTELSGPAAHAIAPSIPVVYAADADVAFADEVARSTHAVPGLGGRIVPSARHREERQPEVFFTTPAPDHHPDDLAPSDDLNDSFALEGGPQEAADGTIDPGPSYATFLAEDDLHAARLGAPTQATAGVLFASDALDVPLSRAANAGARHHQVRTVAAVAVLLNVTVGLLTVKSMGLYPALRHNLVSAMSTSVGALLPNRNGPSTVAAGADETKRLDGQMQATRAQEAREAQEAIPLTASTASAQGAPAVLPTSSPATPDEIASLRLRQRHDVSGPFSDASLSSDGGLVAFADDRDDQPRGIYIARRDGSGAQRVSGSGRAASPAWSPDRGWLSFVRTEPERPEVWNLWVYRVDTGELRRLSSYERGVVRGATWFPHGERLCYGHGAALTIVDVETGRTHDFPSPRADRAVGRSSVSPDGREVAFALERDGVWLLDVETGRMRRVIEDAGATDDVTWADRGGRLLYYSLSARGEGTWRGAPTNTPAAFALK